MSNPHIIHRSPAELEELYLQCDGATGSKRSDMLRATGRRATLMILLLLLLLLLLILIIIISIIIIIIIIIINIIIDIVIKIILTIMLTIIVSRGAPCNSVGMYKC